MTTTTPSITRAEAQRICNLLGVYMAMDDDDRIWMCYVIKPYYIREIREWGMVAPYTICERFLTISDYDGTAADSLISPEGME